MYTQSVIDGLFNTGNSLLLECIDKNRHVLRQIDRWIDDDIYFH